MAEARKEMELEEDEILRVSVRKKHPGAEDEEYGYEMCIVEDDNDAVRLAEIFERALDKEIDLELLIKVFEKAIEEGIDLSNVLEEYI